MVDIVGPVSFQSTQPRVNTPTGSPAPAPAPQQTESQPVTSRIRVDNARNVAFLEYVSARTGQVVRQYPSEKQIQAFRQAEKLVQEARRAPTAENAPETPAPQTTENTGAQETAGPPLAPPAAPVAAQTTAPVTTTTASPAPQSAPAPQSPSQSFLA